MKYRAICRKQGHMAAHQNNCLRRSRIILFLIASSKKYRRPETPYLFMLVAKSLFFRI